MDRKSPGGEENGPAPQQEQQQGVGGVEEELPPPAPPAVVEEKEGAGGQSPEGHGSLQGGPFSSALSLLQHSCVFCGLQMNSFSSHQGLCCLFPSVSPAFESFCISSYGAKHVVTWAVSTTKGHALLQV